MLDGKVRDEVVREMKAGYDAGDSGHREYHYDMQNWREPYLARRRACGFGLYNTIGIPRGDKERMRAQQGRNYQFFDAPVGLIFSIDRDLEIGSWVDYGMFLQSIMVAARSFGLETCPQAALCSRHALLQKRLGIPPEQMVVCGMALGYADRDAIVNTFVTERMRARGVRDVRRRGERRVEDGTGRTRCSCKHPPSPRQAFPPCGDGGNICTFPSVCQSVRRRKVLIRTD